MHDDAKSDRPAPRPHTSREERLAEALRANLLRRKSLARARKGRDGGTGSNSAPDGNTGRR